MRQIHRSIAVSISPNPEEMADVFWEWDAHQQIRFFATLGRNAGIDWHMQAHAIVSYAEAMKDRDLDCEAALKALRIIAEQVRYEP